MEKVKVKKRRVYGPGEILWLAILFLLAALILYPLFWILMSSFKDYNGIYGDVWGLPDIWHVENYMTAWNRGISQYFLNSLIVTICTLAGVVFASTFSAFGICQMKGRLGNFVFLFCLCGLLLSPQVCLLPLFMLLKSLKLKNTLFAMILPYIAFRLPVSIMLIRSFFVGISRELEEAATIDGAGIFTIYYKICMPLVKPAALTLVVFSFQGLWNTTGGSYIYEEVWKLVPTVLNDVAAGGMARVGAASAASVLLMIPPCVLFITLESRIVETMAFSGIKG